MRLSLPARGIFSLAAVAPLIAVLLLNFAVQALTATEKLTDNALSADVVIPVVAALIVFVIALVILKTYIYFVKKYPKSGRNEKNDAERDAETDGEGELFKSIALIRDSHNLILFILVYLLPIVLSQPITMPQALLFAFLLFAGLLGCRTVAISPMLSILGYRCYRVQTRQGTECVLLSKRNILSAEKKIPYAALDDFTFVEMPKNKDKESS